MALTSSYRNGQGLRSGAGGLAVEGGVARVSAFKQTLATAP